MNLIVLTDVERARFAAYCYQEATMYNGMAEETEKLPAMAFLAPRERGTAAAFMLVGAKVDPGNSEEVTLSPTSG